MVHFKQFQKFCEKMNFSSRGVFMGWSAHPIGLNI